MSKKVHKKKAALPHDWRLKVSRILAAHGTELSGQQVYDVFRGRNTDPELVEKVASAMAQVKQQYKLQQRKAFRLQKLAAIFFLFIWVAYPFTPNWYE